MIALRKDMTMTSFGGGGDTFAPFWNPTRDLAHSSSRGGRDMHLDVMEVPCHQKVAFQQTVRLCIYCMYQLVPVHAVREQV